MKGWAPQGHEPKDGGSGLAPSPLAYPLRTARSPLIRDRTGAGRVAGKKRGVKFGRKPKLTPEQVVLALRLVDEGQSVPQVADAFGVHETTIYRCLSAAEAAA